jgi:hypothetical protein
MPKNLNLLLASMTASLLLAGCCTSRHATAWEYKVAYPSGDAIRHETQETLLNDSAREGWVFLTKDANGAFIFKRPLR